MRTLSPEDFKATYGVGAASTFTQKDPQEGLFTAISNDIKRRGAENVNMLDREATADASLADNAVTGLKVAANTAGGVGAAAGEALKRIPGVGGLLEKAGQAIGTGFKGLTDAIGGTKFMQEAAQGLEPGNPLEQSLSAASAGGEIAGNILGAEVGIGSLRKVAEVPGKVAENIPKPSLGKTGEYLKGAVRDITPTKQSLINENIAKALDLTPGDLNRIFQSTGNDIGDWMSKHNLIGTNKPSTEGLIDGFFKTNYEGVRDAIKQVKTTYKAESVPRYVETLTELSKKIEKVPGLEKEASQIATLLRKKNVTLEDVQVVKELLDEHSRLYNVTGDILAGKEKQGLANMRSDIKSFIEREVKKVTGEDIGQMNNDVATAKGILKAIEVRSQRGLTRTHLTTRDWMTGLGLTYFGSPLLGAAFVVGQKLATSPTARLRFARWLDARSDAEKLKISQDLANGKVPSEAERAINGPQ